MIEETIKQNIGERATIFLKNGFRYSGEILDYEDNFMKIIDEYNTTERIINIDSIENIEFGGSK
jgi:hypothetical protein